MWAGSGHGGSRILSLSGKKKGGLGAALKAMEWLKSYFFLVAFGFPN
jgi:hypothetical protein